MKVCQLRSKNVPGKPSSVLELILTIPDSDSSEFIPAFPFIPFV
jgi:hypothetical protein